MFMIKICIIVRLVVVVGLRRVKFPKCWKGMSMTNIWLTLGRSLVSKPMPVSKIFACLRGHVDMLHEMAQLEEK